MKNILKPVTLSLTFIFPAATNQVNAVLCSIHSMDLEIVG